VSTDDKALRKHLLEFLHGGNAHVDVATVVDDFPEELYGSKPKGAPYTPWQLLEHIRFTVSDLLLFSTDPKYTAPKWPDDYWPTEDAPPSKDDWKKSVKALKSDFAAFEKLAQDPDSNLYAEIPWGEGQTMLREVMIACTHTSYHLGELVLLRRQLGAWKK
jgi:hypothetical protein